MHQHHFGCTHCGCDNPLLTLLEGPITTYLKQQQKNTPTQQTQSIQNRIYICADDSATIRPMNDGNCATVKAIGFYNGKVVAQGNQEQVKDAMRLAQHSLGGHYETVYLKDKQTLLPGLMEPHVHIVPTSLTETWADFSSFEGQALKRDYDLNTIEEILIEENKRFTTDGINSDWWLLGQGLDPALMPLQDVQGKSTQLTQINIQALDSICQRQNINRPIFITSASLHTAYINTQALELIASKHTDVPNIYQEICKQGALQELDQMGLATQVIPKEQLSTSINGTFEKMTKLFTTAKHRGVTFMLDAGMTPLQLDLIKLHKLMQPDTSRVAFAKLVKTNQQAKELESYQAVTEGELNQPFQTCIKLISDGSNQGLTGALSQEYCCDSTTPYGIFNFQSPRAAKAQVPENAPEYYELAKDVIAKGWPLMIHANGDAAIDVTLNVYEKALNGQNGITKRHRIEHCSLLNAERAEKMSKLGISPSFLIGHVGYWGYAFKQAILGERADQELDLCQTMIQKNAIITLHSDLSVSPLGPLRLMEQAVTRIMERTPNSSATCSSQDLTNVLNPQERLTREQGLKAITYNAAWQCHVDQFIGELTPGKLADYVILQNDPLTITDPSKIRDIKVEQTWVGGRQIHALPCTA